MSEENKKDFSHLPSGVREKAEMAYEIEEELRKAQKLIDGPPPEPEEPESDPQPQQEPETEPEPEGSDQEPTPPPTEGQEVSVDQAIQAAEEWRTRFVNYKTSTDQTIHQLRVENKALSETVTMLRQKVDKLNKIAEEYDRLKSQSASTKLSEELGEDSAKIIDEYIKNVVEPLQQRNQELEQELNAVKGVTTETIVQNKQQSVIDRVRANFPAFDLVDNDPRFMEYVKSIDPFSGKSIQELIAEAARSENIRYILEVYQDFYNLAYMQPQQPNPELEQLNPFKRGNEPQAPPTEEALQKRTGVAGGGSPSHADVSTDKRMWTADEVKQFYLDKALKRIDPATAKKLEADIEAAYLEGRLAR